MREIDRGLFRWINGWPEELEPVMWFFSHAIKEDWLRIALLLLIVGMIAVGSRARRAALLSLLAWPLANGVTDALKAGFPMERPSVDFAEAIVRGGALTSSGTASAHSANMAAVAVVMVWQLGWWGTPWIAVALLTGLSRIYNGVHYPSQVLLGWAVGAFCAFLIVNTWEAFVRLRARREQADPQAEQPAEA